jgi:hypothetical protein
LAHAAPKPLSARNQKRNTRLTSHYPKVKPTFLSTPLTHYENSGNPKLYTIAVERLGVKPAEAVALEDSLNGATVAVAAGLATVVVPNQVTSDQPFPPELPRLNGFEGGLRNVQSALRTNSGPTAR